MSIADKITALQSARSAIANAITAKGGTVASGDGFADFAADISAISGGGGGSPVVSYSIVPRIKISITPIVTEITE